MTIFRTVLVTIPRTISRTTKLTSNNRTHSLYQHISGIKNGHNESGPGKPYDISCATLRTFNINICVSFLLFVYPTLNAGLVDPFCRAPAPTNKIVINKSKSYTCLIFCGKLFWYDITICWDEILLLFPNEKKKTCLGPLRKLFTLFSSQNIVTATQNNVPKYCINGHEQV